MQDNLAERETAFGELFPWDHANYGMDEHWLRCWPYEQTVSPGDSAEIELQATNHSVRTWGLEAQPVLPAAWQVSVPPAETLVRPRSDGSIRFTVPVPATAGPAGSRVAIPLQVRYGNRSLGQFREAVLVIGDA
jgi:hypothetical protein